uniref:DNA-directed RNA polymerase n=1 Tax=Colemanosphaera angeleri TaxID=1454018 RepID=A0A6C0RXQ1_9CHLO|nr:beta subunit of RNA polymerase [Colemanosphaera angeleri]QIA47162.1 beta subunit of RNA polymerase [Colemanosphaera angeleri]
MNINKKHLNYYNIEDQCFADSKATKITKGDLNFNRYFISDFVEIQRKSFYTLLEKGIIEEFSKRNPITNNKKTIELFFYPDYYQLTPPEYTPSQAILKSKSYTSKLYIPVQLTEKTFMSDFKQKKPKTPFYFQNPTKFFTQSKMIKLKWVYIGDIPLMTKRGHFILNGCARVIVNQMIRSPGIYYQKKNYENFSTKWSEKPQNTFTRYYADLICNRGTWLRIEMDKYNKIWAQMKRVPKIPIMWFLIAVGLTDKIVLKSIIDSKILLYNFQEDPFNSQKKSLPYVKTPPAAWTKIYNIVFSKKIKKTQNKSRTNKNLKQTTKTKQKKDIIISTKLLLESHNQLFYNSSFNQTECITLKKELELKSEQGRKWIFNKFMNPRTYDLGKVGRLNFNNKLKLSIPSNITTLTPQDFLAATNYLILVSKGLRELDDIDHLKNRRVRTSGELIQMQIGVGLVRLEKTIREKMSLLAYGHRSESLLSTKSSANTAKKSKNTSLVSLKTKENKTNKDKIDISNIINTKPFNGALREFFGTSPLSQFMDQINPLAELTHKRRLSSMGPGGVTRDSATLAIRGIHPSHYGRICPVETPEGKNTGLVNSLTAYARVNSEGYIETPFYKVYKGQVQKKKGLYFFSAKQEEKIKLGAPDLYTSDIGFLPKASIPVRIIEDFTKISRNELQFVGVAPIQMISIATSLIPFFEHDDANRALMGSNMQRQAVPILKPQRPIVGTGLEARAVSDSGHVVTAKSSGIVTYTSSNKIIIYTL